jgi:hypothetical protein
MKHISYAAMAFVAAAAALAAQTPAQPQNQAANPSSSTITVVGCMQNAEADGSLGGTPLGTSATPANAGVVANRQEPVPDGFILTGARPAASTGTAAVGTAPPAPTGTAGAVSPSTAPPASDAPAKQELKTYALEGNVSEFTAHKGHRVEVTGTLAPPVSVERDRGANPNQEAFRTGVQRLRVQSLKMVASTCQQ